MLRDKRFRKRPGSVQNEPNEGVEQIDRPASSLPPIRHNGPQAAPMFTCL